MVPPKVRDTIMSDLESLGFTEGYEADTIFVQRLNRIQPKMAIRPAVLHSFS